MGRPKNMNPEPFQESTGRWRQKVWLNDGTLKWATGSTAQEVRKKAKQMRAQDQKGEKVNTKPLTFNEIFDRYLAEQCPPHPRSHFKRPPKNQKGAAQLLTHMRERIGSKRYGSVSPHDLNVVFNKMRDEVNQKGQPYSASHLKMVYDRFRAAMAWAFYANLISFNPADQMLAPDTEELGKREGRPYTLDETLNKVIPAFENGGLVGVVALVQLTMGIRPQEVTKLIWSDFSLTDEIPVLHVQAHPEMNYKLKNKNSDRRLEIPRYTLDLLLRHRAEMNMIGFYSPTSYALPSRNGTCYEQSSGYRTQMKRITERAGLGKDRCPYDLRRTYATIAKIFLGQENFFSDDQKTRLIGSSMGHTGTNSSVTQGYITQPPEALPRMIWDHYLSPSTPEGHELELGASRLLQTP